MSRFLSFGCKDASREEASETAEKAGQKAKEVATVLEEKAKDAQITADIKLKFAKDEDVSALRIDIDTRDHVVTLNGTVQNQTEASKAVEIARSTEGVREVVSNLKIGPPSTAGERDEEGGKLEEELEEASRAAEKKLKEGVEDLEDLTGDARITAAVKIKFAADEDVSAREIDVDTKNGVVTLRGKVDSPQEVDKAIDLARSTEGVKEVVSQLEVGSI